MKILLLLTLLIQISFSFDHLNFNTKFLHIQKTGGGFVFKGEKGPRENGYYAIIEKEVFFDKYDYCTLGGMRADIKGSTCQFGWYGLNKKSKIFFYQNGKYSECSWICK